MRELKSIEKYLELQDPGTVPFFLVSSFQLDILTCIPFYNEMPILTLFGDVHFE